MRMQDNPWFHPARLRMKRLWLLFAQTVTVLVAVFFVVATLQPQWLGRRALPSVVPVFEAAPGSSPAAGDPGTVSLRAAAKAASPAVVSINTSKAPANNPNSADPWFRFFFGDQMDNQPQTGLGSGVILSPAGYVLTNNHVIEEADEIQVSLTDGRNAIAKVIGTDPIRPPPKQQREKHISASFLFRLRFRAHRKETEFRVRVCGGPRFMNFCFV